MSEQLDISVVIDEVHLEDGEQEDTGGLIDPRAEIDIPVHPVADLFPMMSDEELNDLAEDIRENGLLHKIVLDEKGQIVDGRNRYVGCKRASYPHEFETLNGHQADSFILSANIARRHLTKGQRALAIAQMREKHTQSECLRTMKEAASKFGVPLRYLSMAKTILEHARNLVPKVMDTGENALQLQDAWEEARRRKMALETDEEKIQRLQRSYPDLAQMYRDEQLTLAGALAEAAERKRQQEEAEERERQRVSTLTRRFETLLSALEPPEAMDSDEWAADWLNADPGLIDGGADFSAERAIRAADALMRYARLKQEQDSGREQQTSEASGDR